MLFMTPSAHAVPDELMHRLHDAMARFHAAREELERSMAGAEYRHQERIDLAADHLRQAERDLQQIDEAIKEIWRSNPSGCAGHR
jgi:hypothetical protein